MNTSNWCGRRHRGRFCPSCRVRPCCRVRWGRIWRIRTACCARGMTRRSAAGGCDDLRGIVRKGVSMVVNHKQIKAALARAERKLAPDVLRIRYSMEEDWMGIPSVFFRVLLRNEASRGSRLREIVLRAQEVVTNEVKPRQFAERSYFDWRNASEQAELKEEAWN